MVQKDNPKAIPADLLSLTRSNCYVVVGDPQSGSIGRETKRILERREVNAANQIRNREPTHGRYGPSIRGSNPHRRR